MRVRDAPGVAPVGMIRLELDLTKKDATYLKKRGDCRIVVVLHSTTTRVISREICPR